MGLSSITKIPGVMRAQGWRVGPVLMDKWFGRPSAVAPSYSSPDTTTVTMNWVLGFPRARQVYDNLIRERIWQNDAGKRRVREVLGKKNLLGSGASSFDGTRRPIPQLEDEYVNYRPVSASLTSDPLDDLFAGLANFNLRVVIAGQVEPVSGQPGKFRVTVARVGVYVQDSYDFNDDPAGLNPKTWVSQPLGVWDETTNKVSKAPFSGGVYVTNETFRAWRTANHNGGDFLVFSDVLFTDVRPADSFVI